MQKPVIGVLAGLKSPDPNWNRISKTVSVNYSYILSILNSGGLPLIVPPAESGEALESIVDKVDGILVTGGNDLQPQIYGEEPGWGQGSFSPERDHLDLVCIRAARERKKPILGICRGIQAINAAFGGTLYQDLQAEKFSTVRHVQDSESSCASHTVEIYSDSILYPILGSAVMTNSFHHQAVKQPAVGFRIGARAKDGVIEEIESTGGPFILGIQWHPESMAASGDTAMQKIFSLLVRACTDARKG